MDGNLEQANQPWTTCRGLETIASHPAASSEESKKRSQNLIETEPEATQAFLTHLQKVTGQVSKASQFVRTSAEVDLIRYQAFPAPRTDHQFPVFAFCKCALDFLTKEF